MYVIAAGNGSTNGSRNGSTTGAPAGGMGPGAGTVLPTVWQLVDGKSPKEFDHFEDSGFDPRNIHPDLWAQTTLAEILPLVGAATDRMQVVLEETINKAGGIKTDLREALGDRAVVLRDFGAEIVDQSASFHHYFYNVLSLHPITHPATTRLISIAIRVSGIVGMQWKLKFKRARPVQVWPGLLPLIPTPPHPSYPSNHATQAMTAALLLMDALDEKDPNSGIGKYLINLAKRIAINREKAGVHFRSDSDAGFALAEIITTALAGSNTVRKLTTSCAEELTQFKSSQKKSDGNDEQSNT